MIGQIRAINLTSPEWTKKISTIDRTDAFLIKFLFSCVYTVRESLLFIYSKTIMYT